MNRRQFLVGDRVRIINPDLLGTILRIRFDSNAGRLVTVKLDDRTATPDGYGLFVARDFELTRLETI